jgi:hypothetical protein
LSFTVVVGCFLWVTYSQFAPVCYGTVLGYGYVGYYCWVTDYGYYVYFTAFYAAALFLTGFVKSIYLFNISCSVSISSSGSSSMVASGG